MNQAKLKMFYALCVTMIFIDIQSAAKTAVTKIVAAPVKSANKTLSSANSKALQASNAAALAKKFSALQQTPAYKSAMTIVQDKTMQTIYNNSLQSITTFFTQYAAQISASTGHGKVPSTSGINAAMTTLAGTAQTFSMQNQQIALSNVFQNIMAQSTAAASSSQAE